MHNREPTLTHYIDNFYRKLALKTALGSYVVAIVVMLLGMQYGYLAIVTVLTLMTFFIREAISRGVGRLVGSICGALVSFLVIPLFITDPFLYFCALFLLIFIFAYLFAIDTYAYPALISCLTISLVMLMALESPATAVKLGFEWLFGIAIGLLIVIALVRYIPPLLSYESLYWLLSKVCYEIKLLFTNEYARLIAKEKFPLRETQINEEYFEKLTDLTNLSKQEKPEKAKEVTEFVALISRIKRIKCIIDSLTINYLLLNDPIFKYFMKLLLQANNQFALLFSQFANDIKKQQLNQLGTRSIVQSLDRCLLEFGRLRTENHLTKFSTDDLLSISVYLNKLRTLLNYIEKVNNNIDTIKALETKTRTNTILSYDYASVLVKIRTSFSYSRNALKRALKLSIAIVSGVFMIYYLKIPAGIQMLIALSIYVAQANIGSAHERFKLRFLGVVAGTIASLVIVIILLAYPVFWLFSILFILTIYWGVYFSLAKRRYAYVGMQAAIVLPLVMLSASGPVGNIGIALQRVLGVFMGALWAAIVIHYLWPEHPEEILQHKLLILFRKISQSLNKLCTSNSTDANQTKQPKEYNFEQLQDQARALLSDMRNKLFGKSIKAESYFDLVDYINSIIRQIDRIHIAVDRLTAEEHAWFCHQFSAETDQIILFFNRASDILAQKNYIEPKQGLTITKNYFSEKIYQQREDHATDQLSTWAVLQYSTIVNAISAILTLGIAIERKLSKHFHNGEKALQTNTNSIF